MDLTLLPYEILQLIASSLLPKYQCRLALTSRFCYQYLYTDLLRWHVQKDIIPVPKYKIIYSEMSKYDLGEKSITNEYIPSTGELHIYDFGRSIAQYCGDYECAAYGTPIRVLYDMKIE